MKHVWKEHWELVNTGYICADCSCKIEAFVAGENVILTMSKDNNQIVLFKL
jgi:hypothetical protein